MGAGASVPDVRHWPAEAVLEQLAAAKLQLHARLVEEHELNGRRVLALNDAELRALGVGSGLQRKKILRLVDKLRAASDPVPTSPGAGALPGEAEVEPLALELEPPTIGAAAAPEPVAPSRTSSTTTGRTSSVCGGGGANLGLAATAVLGDAPFVLASRVEAADPDAGLAELRAVGDCVASAATHVQACGGRALLVVGDTLLSAWADADAAAGCAQSLRSVCPQQLLAARPEPAAMTAAPLARLGPQLTMTARGAVSVLPDVPLGAAVDPTTLALAPADHNPATPAAPGAAAKVPFVLGPALGASTGGTMLKCSAARCGDALDAVLRACVLAANATGGATAVVETEGGPGTASLTVMYDSASAALEGALRMHAEQPAGGEVCVGVATGSSPLERVSTRLMRMAHGGVRCCGDTHAAALRHVRFSSAGAPPSMRVPGRRTPVTVHEPLLVAASGHVRTPLPYAMLRGGLQQLPPVDAALVSGAGLHWVCGSVSASGAVLADAARAAAALGRRVLRARASPRGRFSPYSLWTGVVRELLGMTAACASAAAAAEAAAVGVAQTLEAGEDEAELAYELRHVLGLELSLGVAEQTGPVGVAARVATVVTALIRAAEQPIALLLTLGDVELDALSADLVLAVADTGVLVVVGVAGDVPAWGADAGGEVALAPRDFDCQGPEAEEAPMAFAALQEAAAAGLDVLDARPGRRVAAALAEGATPPRALVEEAVAECDAAFAPGEAAALLAACGLGADAHAQLLADARWPGVPAPTPSPPPPGPQAVEDVRVLQRAWLAALRGGHVAEAKRLALQGWEQYAGPVAAVHDPGVCAAAAVALCLALEGAPAGDVTPWLQDARGLCTRHRSSVERAYLGVTAAVIAWMQGDSVGLDMELAAMRNARGRGYVVHVARALREGVEGVLGPVLGCIVSPGSGSGSGSGSAEVAACGELGRLVALVRPS